MKNNLKINTDNLYIITLISYTANLMNFMGMATTKAYFDKIFYILMDIFTMRYMKFIKKLAGFKYAIWQTLEKQKFVN